MTITFLFLLVFQIQIYHTAFRYSVLVEETQDTISGDIDINQHIMSQMSLPSKSTLAASTIPAALYLGYLIMTKSDNQNVNKNNSNSRTGYNFNNSTSSQQSLNSFNSKLQEKLFQVQRSRLDPIEEEKQYWQHQKLELFKLYF